MSAASSNPSELQVIRRFGEPTIDHSATSVTDEWYNSDLNFPDKWIAPGYGELIARQSNRWYSLMLSKPRAEMRLLCDNLPSRHSMDHPELDSPVVHLGNNTRVFD